MYIHPHALVTANTSTPISVATTTSEPHRAVNAPNPQKYLDATIGTSRIVVCLCIITCLQVVTVRFVALTLVLRLNRNPSRLLDIYEKYTYALYPTHKI